MPFQIINIPPNYYYSGESVRKLLNSLSADVLQTYSSYYARLILFDYASPKKIPTVVEHHDIDVEHMNVYEKHGVNRWQKESLERASLSRILSEADAIKLKSLAPKAANKMVTIPTILPEKPVIINSQS